MDLEENDLYANTDLQIQALILNQCHYDAGLLRIFPVKSKNANNKHKWAYMKLMKKIVSYFNVKQENMTEEWIKQNHSYVIYPHFKPEKIHQKLKEVYKNYSAEKKQTLTEDIMEFIFLYLKYGNQKVVGSLKHCIPNLQKYTDLIQKYKIKTTIKDGDNPTTTLTLDRIAHSCPLFVIAAVKAHPEINTRVPAEEIVKQGFPGFRGEYKTYAWFNIIPRNGNYTAFIKGILFYIYTEIETIERYNLNAKNPTEEERMTNSIIFAKLHFYSKVVDEDKKQLLMDEAYGTMKLTKNEETEWSRSFDRIFPYFGWIIQRIFLQKPEVSDCNLGQ